MDLIGRANNRLILDILKRIKYLNYLIFPDYCSVPLFTHDFWPEVFSSNSDLTPE